MVRTVPRASSFYGDYKGVSGTVFHALNFNHEPHKPHEQKRERVNELGEKEGNFGG